MNTTQKPVPPIASPNAKGAHAAPPAAACHTTPLSAGPGPTCIVHRLEEALELVESMQLTSDQKTRIAQLTKAQSARCAEEKRQHKATHEQILAILTPEQHEKLEAADAGPEHCHKDGPVAHEKIAVHV
jgi:Spy/CpxP family protein refolding chaperone